MTLVLQDRMGAFTVSGVDFFTIDNDICKAYFADGAEEEYPEAQLIRGAKED